MAVSGLKLKSLPALTVITAGTPVPVYPTTFLVYALTVQSDVSNTGTQLVGDSTVTANGVKFSPSDTIEVEAPAGARGVDQFDVSKIYIDSTTNGAQFRVIAWIRE